MTVRRIVANIAAPDPGRAHAFYETLLGLEVVMDHGWILTFASEGSAMPQTQRGERRRLGHAGSRPVDRGRRCRRDPSARDIGGFEITYGITDEPWGVRRFFVRDPFGKLVNILSHLAR